MKPALVPFGRFSSRWMVASALCALLAACGGGESSSMADGKAASAAPGGASTLPDAASFAHGAALNSAELAAAEQKAQAIAQGSSAANPAPLLASLQAGQIASKSDYASGFVAKTASAARVPAFRFYNSTTGGHFFTTEPAERDFVNATYSPPFAYEGPRFSVANNFAPGLSPVHRFFNTTTGVHFYTISEAERAFVVATYPQFHYEQVVYYASQVAGAGLVPLYRFYAPSRGFHFYTASQSERDNVIASYSAVYNYEGVGYYVLGDDWRPPAVSHTGITSSQCYAAGSDALVSCASAGANNLNTQQDGDRTAVNPMSFGRIVSGSSGPPFWLPLLYPKTDCVRDDVTGLVWEGKQASGIRAGNNTYTNYGDNRSGDAGAYVNTVNAMNLCGFNDWRLPAVDELQAIKDHGRAVGLQIDTANFPNTPTTGSTWTGSLYPGLSNLKRVVGFYTAGVAGANESAAYAVRLVRGSPWTGPRYMITSAVYPDDGLNNAVMDRKTGLTWRRCGEGQAWTGSACVGSPTLYTHQNALIQGKAVTGWRLPNFRELASLVEWSLDERTIDSDAFPSFGLGKATWTSTPDVRTSEKALLVGFANGFVGATLRTGNYTVQLVRE